MAMMWCPRADEALPLGSWTVLALASEPQRRIRAAYMRARSPYGNAGEPRRLAATGVLGAQLCAGNAGGLLDNVVHFSA